MDNRKKPEDILDIDSLIEEAWWHFLIRWPSQPYYNERVHSAVGPDYIKEAFEEAIREAVSTVIGRIEND